MNKNFQTIVIYLVIIAVFAWLVTGQFSTNPAKNPVKMETGQFIDNAEKGLIYQVVYHSSSGKLNGQFWTSAEAQKKGEKEIKTLEQKKKEEQEKLQALAEGDRSVLEGMSFSDLISTARSNQDSSQIKIEGLKYFESNWAGDDSFTEFAAKNIPGKFQVDTSGPSIWLTLATTMIPMIIIVGIMIFFLRQMNQGSGNVMSFGKSKAKRNQGGEGKVTFKDVAGADEAIQELEEIKDFLANPERYQKLGAKIPKGVLLVGPPGTGKTLLARAVAGEANVPFFTISGSDFVEMFVGVGASRVRDLFEQAKAESPAIIFVDEIDAVGRRRGAGFGGGHDEREQTLNQLLVEMDGFDVKDNVIMIAATNRPDILDPALLRPGRFDRQVVVDSPDLKGREEILKIHAANKPMAEEIDLSVLARRTPGFTGADLANLVNEAALLTARQNKKEITMAELEEGIDRVIAGPERKSRLMTDKEKKIIAYHEAGHAVVGNNLENADPVHKVSIIPRGRALGLTWSVPEEDTFLKSKAGMTDDIAVLLGGRAAEKLTFEDVTTGASNDIERATALAKAMVTRYGMSDALGPQAYGGDEADMLYGRDMARASDHSEETARIIDAEISALVAAGFEKAQSILTERKGVLDLMVDVLLEVETLEGEALEAVFENKWDEFKAGNFVSEKKRALEAAESAEAVGSAETVETAGEVLTPDSKDEK